MSEENVSENSAIKNAPTWFKVVSWIALIWNLLGIMSFAMQMMMTPEIIAALPAAEQALYNSVPGWAIVAFACAVFGGTLGCIFLLLKKSMAFYLLLISVIGVCVQMYHSFFISHSLDVYGPGAAIMPAMILIIGIALVWLAKKAESNGWIS